MANNKVVVEMELNDRGTTAKQIKSAEALLRHMTKQQG
jgi:ribosomal protein L5